MHSYDQLWKLWTRFWFEPSSSTNLGIGRILLVAYILMINWSTTAAVQEMLDGGFGADLWRPFFVFRWFPVPTAESLGAVNALWMIALVLACVGLFTRSATTVAFVLGWYITGIRMNFGKVGHAQQAAIIALLILALSRCGDGWSIDAALRKMRRAAAHATQAVVDARQSRVCNSGEYTWPVRATQWVLVLMFVAAGIAKLRGGGLEWIFSDNLANQMLLRQYRHPEISSWSISAARNAWLYMPMALGVVVLELAAPLLMIRRMRRWLLPVYIGLAFSFATVLGVHTASANWSLFLFFIPWDRLVQRLSPAAC